MTMQLTAPSQSRRGLLAAAVIATALVPTAWIGADGLVSRGPALSAGHTTVTITRAAPGGWTASQAYADSLIAQAHDWAPRTPGWTASQAYADSLVSWARGWEPTTRAR